MTKTLFVLLLALTVNAATLKGSPQLLPVINDKIRYWSEKAQWAPDGKMFALRQDLNDSQSPFIINIEPDLRMISPTNRLNDVTTAVGGNRKDYPGALPSRGGINYVELPNNVSIPPADVTGTRGDGTHYDYNSIWLMNAFRLSETSQPDAPSSHLIGFVHNEDYWGYGGAVNGCTYKSVGVRYSQDLGKSWTRSVPILTKLIQPPVQNCNLAPPAGNAGVGDFAAMWNHLNNSWAIFAQESSFKPWTSPGLVMSVSHDPLARPGNWTRLDPVSNKTQPGFIGGNDTLAHPDLDSVKGASPSIIRDDKNGVWHMVYSKWGGGLAYTNSTDMARWTKPEILPLNNTEHRGTGYPTLIGDQGDTRTTDGTAVLYFTDATNTTRVGMWGRPIWSVDIDFNSPARSQGDLVWEQQVAGESRSSKERESELQQPVFVEL